MEIRTIEITEVEAETSRRATKIFIGRRGENAARRIVFDATYLIETYGLGDPVLIVKRPNDTDPYVVQVDLDGNDVIWTVTNIDTANVGYGQCELFWYINNSLAKTIIYTIQIDPDIGFNITDPPDAYETWIETLVALAISSDDVRTIMGGVESTSTASKNYSVGNLLIMDDTLYRVTAAISTGDTIASGTNAAQTTILEQLAAIAGRAAILG